jgi:hypothetical protein
VYESESVIFLCNAIHELTTQTENDVKLGNLITELEAENKSLKDTLKDTTEVEKELARVQVELYGFLFSFYST